MPWPKGRKPSPEHRAKIRAAHKGKPRSAKTRAKISSSLTGSRHPAWTGDEVSYQAFHQRLRDLKGPASRHPCVDCGEQAREWSYKLPTGHSSNPDDYSARCRSCHIRHDRRSA